MEQRWCTHAPQMVLNYISQCPQRISGARGLTWPSHRGQSVFPVGSQKMLPKTKTFSQSEITCAPAGLAPGTSPLSAHPRALGGQG